eukprot:3158687-Rhodomonas_salina.1
MPTYLELQLLCTARHIPFRNRTSCSKSVSGCRRSPILCCSRSQFSQAVKNGAPIELPVVERQPMSALDIAEQKHCQI